MINTEDEKRAQLLETILDTSPNCVYVKDKQGRYIIANKTIANLYQTTPNEMIGKKDEDFANQAILKPNEAAFFKDIDKKAIEKKETQVIPCESFTYNDGTVHYFFTTKTPITYQGDPDCVMGISVDITKLKESEKQVFESESKFQNIFNNSTMGYSLTKPDGTLSEVNNAFALMLGYSIEELSQMNFEDITHPHDIAESKKCIKTLLSGAGDTYRFEKRYYHKNGDIVWADVSTTLMKDMDDNALFFITSIQDITVKKEAENEIRESEKKYHILFDTMAQGVVYQNAEGKIISANPAAERILGLTLSQMQGRTSMDPRWKAVDKDKNILPGDKHPAMAALKTGEKVSDFLQGIFNPKKNDYTWIIVNSVPQFKEGSETPYMVYSTFLDVTDRVNAEQSIKDREEKLRLKLDSVLSPDVELSKDDFANIINSDSVQSLMDDFYQLTNIGVAVVDMNGNILVATGWQDVCTKFHRVHPETKKNCIESDVHLTQHVKSGEYIKYKCKNNMWDMATPICVGGKRLGTVFLGQFFLEGEAIDYEFFEKQAERYGFDKNKYLTALEQVPRWSEETISTVMSFYAKLSNLIAQLSYSNLKLAKTVEKQKRTEQDLQKTYEKLQDLNKKLEQKVEDRTQQIQMILNQKDEFINQLGHDIKNPLGPLVNLLPILEKKVNDPNQKEMIQVMNRNVMYIKNLATRTIQLAQLKSPSTGLHPQQFDLGKEIQDIVRNNQLHFDEKQITIDNKIPEGIVINADKLKIEEVFNNLLNNAVKYNKKQGNIIINQKIDEDTITVSIKDTGVGMTSEQLQRVFDEFYKADSSRHDFNSSGLGMAITKRIIEMHDGNIWAESGGIGKGSTFYFTLPKSRNQQ